MSSGKFEDYKPCVCCWNNCLTLKTETVCSSETNTNFNQITACCPDDSILPVRCCEDLRSRSWPVFLNHQAVKMNWGAEMGFTEFLTSILGDTEWLIPFLLLVCTELWPELSLYSLTLSTTLYCSEHFGTERTEKIKLHGLSPRANYTDRATAACRRSDCQRLRIEGATW
jgi:hypothetical protein